jgi:hypothetical protein
VDCARRTGLREAEAVMSALRRLSDELQEAVTHLDGYPGEQLCEQRLNSAKGSSQTPEVSWRTPGHWRSG